MLIRIMSITEFDNGEVHNANLENTILAPTVKKCKTDWG